MSSLAERQNELVNQLSGLDNWENRYKKIIALGKALPDLAPEKKTEEALIKGCQSQVWLHASLSDDGRVMLEGDSDALIVKGLVALLVHLYSGATPEEILYTPPDFIKKIGFEAHLSPSRSNGFFNMLKQIRHFAQAMTVMLAMKKSKS